MAFYSPTNFQWLGHSPGHVKILKIIVVKGTHGHPLIYNLMTTGSAGLCYRYNEAPC